MDLGMRIDCVFKVNKDGGKVPLGQRWESGQFDTMFNEL